MKPYYFLALLTHYITALAGARGNIQAPLAVSVLMWKN